MVSLLYLSDNDIFKSGQKGNLEFVGTAPHIAARHLKGRTNLQNKTDFQSNRHVEHTEKSQSKTVRYMYRLF